MKKKVKICIAASGTGGHVFPGIVLAKKLQQKGCEIIWIANKNPEVAKWVQNSNIYLEQIEITGIRGKGVLALIKAPFIIVRAVWQSIFLLKYSKSNLVLSMGGFVAGPVGVAGKILGIKLALHEQNAIVGKTNKILSIFADMTFSSFADDGINNKKSHYVIGNPISEMLYQVPELKKSSNNSQDNLNANLQVLILGGSLGANFLNDNLPQIFNKISQKQKLTIKIIHQTGTGRFKKINKVYQKMNNPLLDYQTTDFINAMPNILSKTDLIIGRCGASSLTEYMVAKRPAILIPFPFAVDDHQTANAKLMIQYQAADIYQQDENDLPRLEQLITSWLLDEEKRIKASKNLSKFSKKNFGDEIVKNVLQLLNYN